MLYFPDEILLEIIKFLSEEDQINMGQAFPGLSRLRTIITLDIGDPKKSLMPRVSNLPYLKIIKITNVWKINPFSEKIKRKLQDVFSQVPALETIEWKIFPEN